MTSSAGGRSARPFADEARPKAAFRGPARASRFVQARASPCSAQLTLQAGAAGTSGVGYRGNDISSQHPRRQVQRPSRRPATGHPVGRQQARDTIAPGPPAGRAGATDGVFSVTFRARRAGGAGHAPPPRRGRAWRVPMSMPPVTAASRPALSTSPAEPAGAKLHARGRNLPVAVGARAPRPAPEPPRPRRPPRPVRPPHRAPGPRLPPPQAANVGSPNAETGARPRYVQPRPRPTAPALRLARPGPSNLPRGPRPTGVSSSAGQGWRRGRRAGPGRVGGPASAGPPTAASKRLGAPVEVGRAELLGRWVVARPVAGPTRQGHRARGAAAGALSQPGTEAGRHSSVGRSGRGPAPRRTRAAPGPRPGRRQPGPAISRRQRAGCSSILPIRGTIWRGGPRGRGPGGLRRRGTCPGFGRHPGPTRPPGPTRGRPTAVKPRKGFPPTG